MPEMLERNANADLLGCFLSTIPAGLGALLKERRVAAGESWEQSTSQHHMHFVRAGVVSHRVSNSDGMSVSVHLSGAGDLVELAETMSPLPISARAVALFPSQIVQVPSRLLREALCDNAAFREACMRCLTLRYVRTSQLAICNAVHDLQSRVARHLYILTRHSEILFPLTQESLAAELGVQRTSICLVMNDLRARGVLEFSRGHLTILCRGRLAGFACECTEILDQAICGQHGEVQAYESFSVSHVPSLQPIPTPPGNCVRGA